MDIDPPPILFLDEETDSIYVKEEDQIIPIKTNSKEQEVRRLFDPSFYLTLADAYRESIKS